MPLVNRSRARCSASYLGGSESSGGAKAPSAIVTDTSALLPWAARKRTFQNRRSGPRPCENVSTCRERRTSPLDCASAESIHTAHAPLKVLLENCIFHISPMYEFSHSLGPSRPCLKNSCPQGPESGRTIMPVIRGNLA